MDHGQQRAAPSQLELEQQPDLWLTMEAPAWAGTSIAVVIPQSAAQRTPYQGA